MGFLLMPMALLGGSNVIAPLCFILLHPTTVRLYPCLLFGIMCNHSHSQLRRRESGTPGVLWPPLKMQRVDCNIFFFFFFFPLLYLNMCAVAGILSNVFHIMPQPGKVISIFSIFFCCLTNNSSALVTWYPVCFCRCSWHRHPKLSFVTLGIWCNTKIKFVDVNGAKQCQ